MGVSIVARGVRSVEIILRGGGSTCFCARRGRRARVSRVAVGTNPPQNTYYVSL